MATSGVIETRPFVTRKIIDQAYARCGVYKAKITPDMIETAMAELSTFLLSMANRNIPSWCMERLVLPLYEGQAEIELPIGTINALNVNYRILQPAAQETITTPASTYTYTASNVTTVGVLWDDTSIAVTLQASADNVEWVTVGSIAAGEYEAGEWSWIDVNTLVAYEYFRLTAGAAIEAVEVYLGTLPQEIPLGMLNRDQYVDQTNKSFASQPTNYYPQKNYPLLMLNLWPTPYAAATYCQLVVWRHRNIMAVGTLRQDLELPLVWYEAIQAVLAAKCALATPEVPLERIALLDVKAEKALNDAWDGDGDGTPSLIQVDISPYTR